MQKEENCPVCKIDLEITIDNYNCDDYINVQSQLCEKHYHEWVTSSYDNYENELLDRHLSYLSNRERE